MCNKGRFCFHYIIINNLPFLSSMSRDEWKDRRGEEEDRMIKLLRGEASEGKNAQWFRNAKDWDVSTGPFVCLFMHLLALLTHSLVLYCLLCLLSLLYSFDRLLTHSRAHEKV